MITEEANTDLGNVVKALAGDLGDDQRRIAATGLGWLDMLLRKNQDYGSSAWKAPRLAPQLAAGDAILVRLSDKLERLSTLLANPERAQVDESIEDTMRDAGGYFLLYLARPTPEVKKPEPILHDWPIGRDDDWVAVHANGSRHACSAEEFDDFGVANRVLIFGVGSGGPLIACHPGDVNIRGIWKFARTL